jgi:DNA-binding NtrC family response regulator
LLINELRLPLWLTTCFCIARQVMVKLIAATNRDLRAEVLAGRFREDLFYRLSSIQIRIPSLAERLEDIPLLMQYFLRKYNDAYGKNIAGLTAGRRR